MNTLTPEQFADVKAAVTLGNTLDAIKRYRSHTGADLKTAKDAIEAMNPTTVIPPRPASFSFNKLFNMAFWLAFLFFAVRWIWNDIAHTMRDPFDHEGATRELAQAKPPPTAEEMRGTMAAQQITQWFEENLRDPESFRAMKIGPLQKSKLYGYTAVVTYRATNGFGGYEIEVRQFSFHDDGRLYRVDKIEPEN